MVEKLGEKEFDNLTLYSNEIKKWKKWELQELRDKLRSVIDELSK